MTVIYPVPEYLPDPRARFIQVMNTCHAISRLGVTVILMAGLKRGCSAQSLFSHYGIEPHPSFHFVRLPLLRREQARHFRVSWHGVFHAALLVRLLRLRPRLTEQPVLFVRHIKLAHFLLRFIRSLGMPLLFEAHEIFHLTTMNDRKRARLKALERHVYRKADGIVTISHSLAEHIRDLGITPSSVQVIHNGIGGEFFRTERREPGSYICYTGSLYFWKGVDTLIMAMKFLPSEQLVVVGGGKRLEDLKSLARAEGVADRVSFVGAVPHAEVPRYLSQAKVAVLPNVPDGPTEFSSPLKLFEYMASGVPIVASDVLSFREILTHMHNALLCSPASPESLAHCIGKVVFDPELARRLGETARKDAENYTYDRRARQICSFIEHVEHLQTGSPS